MPRPSQRPLLLVLTGPVGAGKSSTATALATHLRQLGLKAATIDLDVLYCMARQGDGFDDEAIWKTSRHAASAFARLLFASQVDVVVVEGGFYLPEECSELAPGTELLLVTLHVSFEGVLQRVQADPSPDRVASRNPVVLRQLHDQYSAALPYLSQSGPVIDADGQAMQAVVEQIAALVSEGRVRP